jgi:nitrilase
MTDKSEQFRVAAVQASPVFMDLSATVQKTIDLIKNAADSGAKLVAFPECWIPGYPFQIWLGAPAWWMKFVQRYHENTMQLNSAETAEICAAAGENNIMVALGYSERSGGSLYISQLLIGADGMLIANRRKLKPTHMERTVFGEGGGADLDVHDTSLGRVGMLCCWEHLQPLNRFALYSMNEQVHIAAWPSFSLYSGIAHALGSTVNNAASLMYAVEGQCYVVAPCATITEDIIKVICETDDQRQLIHAGGGFAKIYAPDGQSIGNQLGETEEGLVVADIDLSLIALAKAVADPAGHYARPDVTRLLLNRSTAAPVEYMSSNFEDVSAAAQEGESDRKAPDDNIE